MKLIEGVEINLINMYQNLIRENMLNKDYDEALSNLKELRKQIKRCPKVDFGDKSTTVSAMRFYHNTLSNVYYHINMVQKSLFHARQACRLYQNKEDIAKNQWALAMIYEKLNPVKADNIYNMIALYYDLTGKKEYLAMIMNNRANLLRDAELAIAALEIYEELPQTKTVKININNTLDTLINIYLDEGKLQEAKEVINKIADKQLQNTLRTLIFNYQKQYLSLKVV